MIKGSASRRAAVVRRITGGCGRPPANSWTIGWWCISQLLTYLPWSLWTIALGVMLLVRPISLGYSSK